MRYTSQLREEALRLRTTEGYTLRELADYLGVPKSTVNYWVKEVPAATCISPERQRIRAERQRANQLAGTRAMQAKYASRRQQAYDEALHRAPELLNDREIRDFVVLFLAEGTRRDRNVVALSNSNPLIIKFAHHCMNRLATNHNCYCSFQYHTDQDPEQLRRFWGGLLGISPESIKPIRKTNSGHLKGRRFACEHGVFQIKFSDTIFRSKLQALMDVVQKQWA
jgi:transposase-like protein